MKKIALLTLAAVLGSFSSALASSPSSCSPGGACAAAGTCGEIKGVEGESVVAAQKRAMAAELTGLVTRYVYDASLRSELLRTLSSDPRRALDSVAFVESAFSEADRAVFKRISGYFKFKC